MRISYSEWMNQLGPLILNPTNIQYQSSESSSWVHLPDELILGHFGPIAVNSGQRIELDSLDPGPDPGDTWTASIVNDQVEGPREPVAADLRAGGGDSG